VPPALATSLARSLPVASWTYLFAVCLIAAVMWSLGDRWWPATILLFIGRWIFLLPLVVLVPGALVAARRALVPLVIAALVVIFPVMGARAGWRLLGAAPPGTQLRIVSFNVDGGALLVGHMQRLFDEMAPDVLAIQECGSELASSLVDLKDWQHHEVEGLCLLSRYPIRRASVMDRSALEALKEVGGIGGSGAVVRYSIDTPGGPIEFTNLHLETPRKGLERLDAFDVTTLRDRVGPGAALGQCRPGRIRRSLRDRGRFQHSGRKSDLSTLLGRPDRRLLVRRNRSGDDAIQRLDSRAHRPRADRSGMARRQLRHRTRLRVRSSPGDRRYHPPRSIRVKNDQIGCRRAN
jgi:hypothetical protein